jgi:hypothetical protein
VPCIFLAETCLAGLVTRPGSMDEAAPRIARLIQTVARVVFSEALILKTD